MTRRLAGVKARKVRRVLINQGFEIQPGRGKGSHEVYWNPHTNQYTTLSQKK
jgi:predicted RNA binding protein YcfA (HicA-like mRNA interferase family)